jgi:hypothetical protein
MNKMTVDLATSGRLSSLEQAVELCDPSGHILGWFQPAQVEEKKHSFYVPPFTDEELRAAEEEEGGRSISEIMADLEKRS